MEKYSPGFCLLAKLIEEASENTALQVIDLGLGAEDYKERFANRTRETLHVTLQTSVVRHFGTIARFQVATLVRTSPELESKVRSVAARLQRARKRTQERGFAGTLFWLAARLRDSLWSENEVLFCEWSGTAASDTGEGELRPLDLNQLAAAAEQYAEDELTLAYLVRSAQRLRAGKAKGFALMDSMGTPIHFAWITAFNGFFLAELNARVEAPCPEDMLLFDCWTPVAARGHGYYGRAIGRIAYQVRSAGKRPWIFSAATNTASVRGIEKAGFERRYSLVRHKVFNLQRIKGQATGLAESSSCGGFSSRLRVPRYRMRVLLLHPEDFPQRGPWSAQRWDLIVDLGRSSASSAAAWEEATHARVLRSDSFRKGVEDIKQVRKLFSLGMGRLLDEEGIDWWELTSQIIAWETEAVLVFRRMISEIDGTAEIWATRPGWPTSAISALLKRPPQSFSQERSARLSTRVRHYGSLLRRFSSAQIKEIFLDKYDSDYKWRSRFASSTAPLPEPSILLPTAYGNVSRMAAAYAKLLPEQSFLLVATRQSGRLSNLPPNVQTRDLAAYAGGEEPIRETAGDPRTVD